MKRYFLVGTSALAVICASGTAIADVTPQEVWDQMKTFYGVFGVQVEGETSGTDDTLTSNIEFTQDGQMLVNCQRFG